MIDATQYLDSRNMELWEELNSSFNITIKNGQEYCYANYHINNNCTIYVPKIGIPDSASFTHELLHLYLSSHKIYIGGAIECFIREIYPLNTIFDKDLYDHISNCLEHIKMLPVYLNMGYPLESFLSDYNEEKITFERLEQLGKRYKKTSLLSSKYNREAINHYIGIYFAIKADINPNHYYDHHLKILDGIDHTLYSILDVLWDEWNNYDVDKTREVWEDDYHKIIDRFVNELTDWSNNKKFK